MDKDALIDSLQKTIAVQAEQLKHQSTLLEKLTQQVEELLRKLYGKKSEKQKTAADKDEPSNNPPKERDKKTRSSACADKQVDTRIPESLERVDVKYDLPPDEKICQHCQGDLHQMGKRVTEQLDFIPAKLIVKKHICFKYACRCGQGGVRMASMPNQPIEKGLPGPGLLAEVLISKYQDAMPLYRQMLRFKRYGYRCADSTLCDWVKECAVLLKPIVDAMHLDLLKAKQLNTDDTPVPVLAKGKTKTGRLWVYLTDTICIYDYTPNRSQQGSIRFLQGYQGYLQADAYSGYDILFKDGNIIEVGCMTHARRPFFEIATLAKGASYSGDIVALIGKLYEIERRAKLMTAQERYYYRKQFSRPILKKLKCIISYWFKRATVNTPFYKALQYASNHWIALTRYLACGTLSIDNNAAERAIKPVVIGRKNWLFAGSHEGGNRAAIIYSIIETCKMNQINPFDYLKDVLARIPNTLQRDLHMLLPYRWQNSS